MGKLRPTARPSPPRFLAPSPVRHRRGNRATQPRPGRLLRRAPPSAPAAHPGVVRGVQSLRCILGGLCSRPRGVAGNHGFPLAPRTRQFGTLHVAVGALALFVLRRTKRGGSVETGRQARLRRANAGSCAFNAAVVLCARIPTLSRAPSVSILLCCALSNWPAPPAAALPSQFRSAPARPRWEESYPSPTTTGSTAPSS